MSVHWVGLAVAVALLVVVLELLRRGILRERFAILWLVVSGLFVIVAAIPDLLRTATTALGFELPSSVLFFIAILFLLLVCLQLTYEVSRLEARTRRLVEDLALLTASVQDGAVQRPGRRSPGHEESR